MRRFQKLQIAGRMHVLEGGCAEILGRHQDMPGIDGGAAEHAGAL